MEFGDFGQDSNAQPVNNDDAFGAFGGMQMNSQEDAFADAGLPSMSVQPDFSQGFTGSAAPADDYTEEEQ